MGPRHWRGHAQNDGRVQVRGSLIAIQCVLEQGRRHRLTPRGRGRAYKCVGEGCGCGGEGRSGAPASASPWRGSLPSCPSLLTAAPTAPPSSAAQRLPLVCGHSEERHRKHADALHPRGGAEAGCIAPGQHTILHLVQPALKSGAARPTVVEYTLTHWRGWPAVPAATRAGAAGHIQHSVCAALPQVRAVEEAPPDEHENEGLKAFHKLEQHLSP